MPSPTSEPYRLHLLGPWDLRGPDDKRVQSLLAQPKRLCLLAYLALTGEPVSRSTIVSVFWPESDELRARNALSQAVHYLRRSLSKGAVEEVEGDRLQVPVDVVWFDARSLLTDAEPDAEVVQAAGREFMEGWNADDSQPLQEWLDGVRRRVGELAGAELVKESALIEAQVRDAAPLREEARAASTVSAPAQRGKSRRVTIGVAAALVAMFLVHISWPSLPTVEGAEFVPPTTVTVLMPEWIPAGAILAAAAAASVHDEVLAELAAIDGPHVVDGSWASARELSRFLARVGGNDETDWVLTIRVRATHGEAWATAFLLRYRGSDYTVVETMRGEYHYETDSDALHRVPREIAEDIVEAFRGVLGG